ncbi:GNAT family N-acetyltransferase [Psychrobacillus sp. FJAT-51614]|uniref:GNAT family N-acetyltransferase n=1 Tax=Psychrobacillus mangrovi TaxID=3117745 RepID=A0ABU8F1U9_9BACI
MNIREITANDAEKFVDLIKQVEDSSPFMLMEPGERKITVDLQRLAIEQMEKESNSTIFITEQNGELIGYLIVIGGKAKRTKHTAYLVTGILENHRGKGVGTKLFQQLDAWSSDRQIKRIELTVVTQNEAGLSLYQKMGFEIEGTKRSSLLINGELLDEYFMSKIK